MPGDPWSREDIARMCEHPDETLEQGQAAGFYRDRTFHAFRIKKSDLEKKRYSVRDTDALHPPTQLVKRDQTPAERKTYFDALHHAAMLRVRTATRTDETEWFAPDDGLPVGLIFPGDFHQGAHGVDYPELQRHMEILRDTDGLYGVGMGDYHEGVSIHSKAAPALYTGIYNDSGEQEEAVLMTLGIPPPGKWIVLLSGNHDEWVYRHAGLSRVSRLAKQLGIEHFGEGGGTIFATVGDQRYTIGVRHNHAGNSQLNTSNAQRRMVDSWLSWDTLHVAALAHFHFNDLHIAPRHGKRVVYLRCGTFKVHDPYAKGGGFMPELGVPMVILLPDREHVLAYRGDDLEDGLARLAQLREQYAQRAA